MTFAIIETGAKQYKVKVGDTIKIEKIKGDFKDGDKIIFENIVALGDEKKVELGNPTISGQKVEAKLMEMARDKKIRIQKFKSKSNYHKVQGHRQSYFKVEITKI